MHGQSGTGKTIALARLAHETRKGCKAPGNIHRSVLQASAPYSSRHVDAFCEWAENRGAESVLIVWDGMCDVAEYYDLLRYLESRGRKAVVLVGSTYRLKAGNKCCIEAPALLSEAEAKGLAGSLAASIRELASLARDGIVRREANFLVALYRLLPSTRAALRSGLSRRLPQ